MDQLAVGALGAEPKQVVVAHLLMEVFWPVPELAVVAAKLAEAALVVGALLLLFGGAGLGLLRVAVKAPRFLLVAVAVFLEELADRDLLFDVKVEVLAGVTLAAGLLQPVDADLLLELGLVGHH